MTSRHEDLDRRHEQLRRNLGMPAGGAPAPRRGRGKGIVLAAAVALAVLAGAVVLRMGSRPPVDAVRGAPAVSVAKAAKAEPVQRWAVLVGVSDYADPRVPDLNYTVDDVLAMRDVLVQAGYAADHITVLTNGEATVERVRSVLGTQLPREVGARDVVLVFFSGHGGAEPSPSGRSSDGTEKYILLSDSKVDDLYSTALPMSEIARIFERIRADKLLFAVDTCYSGAVGAKGVLRAGMKAAAMDDDYLDMLARSEGTVVLTASRANEVSMESPLLQHGLFTYFLCEGLQGGADTSGDGVVDVAELYAYVSAKVPAEAKKLGCSQNPVMKGQLSGPFPVTGTLSAAARARNRVAPAIDRKPVVRPMDYAKEAAKAKARPAPKGPQVRSTGYIASPRATGVRLELPAPKGPLPPHLDWRERDGVSPLVDDQGPFCGSCWAFASVDVLEAQAAIEGVPCQNLSEQPLVSCDEGYIDGDGCGGGTFDQAFRFLLREGAVEESVWPYENATQSNAVPCREVDAPPSIKPVQALLWCPGQLPASAGRTADDSIKSALCIFGPICVCLLATERFQAWHDCGVFEEVPPVDPATIDHAVLLVGYDDDRGAWLIKNSWGEDWGCNGYAWVKYGSANLCEPNCLIGVMTLRPLSEYGARVLPPSAVAGK